MRARNPSATGLLSEHAKEPQQHQEAGRDTKQPQQKALSHCTHRSPPLAPRFTRAQPWRRSLLGVHLEVPKTANLAEDSRLSGGLPLQALFMVRFLFLSAQSSAPGNQKSCEDGRCAVHTGNRE